MPAMKELKAEHQAVLLTIRILEQIMSKLEAGQAIDRMRLDERKTYPEAETAIKELPKTGFDRWTRIIRVIVLNNGVDYGDSFSGPHSFSRSS